MAVQKVQSFGEVWTGLSVRGTANRIGRHFGDFELFVTVLRHNRVQLATNLSSKNVQLSFGGVRI